MKALLDTHMFIWWNTDDQRLSERAREFIANRHNELFLSAASAWEIAIKAGRGRLTLPQSPQKYVASRMSRHHFQPLPIQISHALHVFTLPDIHRDPFDRLLVAQSQMEKIPIISADSLIARYDVEIVW